ncbi:MAG: hypothetical protein WC683_02950 [bacterium]
MSRLQRRASRSVGRKLMRQGWSEWERVPRPDPAKYPSLRNVEAVFKNNVYVVQIVYHVTEWGTVERLMIRRNDEAPVRSWQELQRVKNEIVGEDRVAIEVFPAQAELVDHANLYHLWVLPKGFTLPFGMKEIR